MVVPLFVGREKSVNAIEIALKTNKKVLLLTQHNATDDDPGFDKMYSTGTICTVMNISKLPDGTVKALIIGDARAKVRDYIQNKGYFEAEVELLQDAPVENDEVSVLTRTILKQFAEYVKLNRKIPPELLTAASNIPSASKLADTMAGHLPIRIEDKQKILEELNVQKRLALISEMLEKEIILSNTETKIRGRVKSQIEKNQKEYFLNEQLKAIHKEMDDEDERNEITDFEKKISELKLSPEAKEKCKSELKKLKTMSALSAEATVIRNYLDWITSIPWHNPSEVNSDIHNAEKVLDKDHYGLDLVKERILEYLAVQGRAKKIRGPILCLVGPPGVGKTSLARSIAEATGREFAKISLGGMRDEAEIRGHRRTYLGSMPGKIIQSMKKTKHSNPLLLLDEIDKMSHDFRGDPSSALLEVLDPEQNVKFNDHYVEVDYDLSDVMFIATANSMNLPRPLLDRMEIIRISGYTEDEKLGIAKRHLVPKLTESHGLAEGEWKVSDEAITDLIRYYTREAGVRSLERELANLARKSVKLIVSGKKTKVAITRQNLGKFAKVRKYKYGETEKTDAVGVTTGLAYTESGGDILQIEAVKMPGGKGKVSYTGNLEKVMRESIEAAASAIRARLLNYGITPPEFMENDIHVHVPEGATPKDGPSAGVAMTTSIVSVLTGIPVKRTVAMTGEIRLSGQVLPIGGLKEKLLAALRSGIKTVLIPIDNVKDLVEIPDNVKNNLEIIPVSTVDEVLKNALVRIPQPITWDPKTKEVGPAGNSSEDNRPNLPH